MVQVLQPDTGFEFFEVDRTTELQIVDFFFEQRNRVLTLISKLKGKASKSRQLMQAKAEYESLCLFELHLGLQHETQANNLGLRLRRNHAMTLQKIFATTTSEAKKLRRALIVIIQRENQPGFFRSPPKQLTEFFKRLLSE